MFAGQEAAKRVVQVSNMSLKAASNNVASILRKISARTTCFVKIYLLSALFLPVLLGSQPAKAESPPLSLLNAGLNDAWFNPETDGQGFFVTVFPELGLIVLAWFTYDTVLPAEDTTANLGDAGQRWLIAVGEFDGNSALLEIESTSGGIFDTPTQIQRVLEGTIVLSFETCDKGTVEYDITSIGQQGTVSIERVANDNIALCEALAPPAPKSCTRPAPDLSHDLDDPPVISGAIVPLSEVIGGGPGPDGIPPLETPLFTEDLSATSISPFELIVGVKIGDDIRAYPYNILNWHEVVNDQFSMDGSPESVTLSYCPLTGSAVLWKSFMEPGNKTFGTSGLLYNSNLILYDRATRSNWSQMLEQAINGVQIKRIPDRLPVVETSWGTWKAMYPATKLLSEATGFSRDYTAYPYGSFREDQSLLFPVNNSNDLRLHRKERVLGINVGASSKVYPISNFSNQVEVINEVVGNMQVVAAGSSGHNFGVIFNRELEDCTVLDFVAVQAKLPVVMRDNEGNEWDIFGTAVSGARKGQQLQKTNSYIAYWFAWTAFFPGAQIQQ